MSKIKAEQIISGIKNALQKCEAVTPQNAHALDNLLDTRVLNDIIKYGKQANGVNSKPANCAIFDVRQRSELLAFKRFISKTPRAELEYYSDEEFTDFYIKANSG